MKKIMLMYGSLSGAIIISITILSLEIFEPGSGMASAEWLGYLIMIIVLSLIFFGVKNYRDAELGGVISFGKAFLVGLGIAVVAGVVYTAIWEIYIQSTGGSFMDMYVDAHIEQMRESGATEEAISMEQQRMDNFKEMYRNPLIRIGITFMEIFPVGLLISLISAAFLRKSDFLPAGEHP